MAATPDNFERILVLSLAGFGDAIMATPLCRVLRQAYPNAHLEALTMWSSSAALYRHLGVFDDVEAHDFFHRSYRETIGLLGRYRRKRFDLSVLTYPANRAHYNAVAGVIGARIRLGHDYRVRAPRHPFAVPTEPTRASTARGAQRHAEPCTRRSAWCADRPHGAPYGGRRTGPA